MEFGDRSEFAITCFHEPRFPNDSNWVFGRMCVWVGGVALGDINEPDCLLNVSEGHLEDTVSAIHDLDNRMLAEMSDADAFAYLDSALYGEDNRDFDEVIADADAYSKHNFLTNAGESFDNVKAILLRSGNELRIVYRLPSDEIGGGIVGREAFVATVTSFFGWMNKEKKIVPTE